MDSFFKLILFNFNFKNIHTCIYILNSNVLYKIDYLNNLKTKQIESNMDLLTNTQEPPKIRVVVRKRPLTSKEEKKADTDIIDI